MESTEQKLGKKSGKKYEGHQGQKNKIIPIPVSLFQTRDLTSTEPKQNKWSHFAEPEIELNSFNHFLKPQLIHYYN